LPAFATIDLLGPGEKVRVMVIAADKKQARVILRYIRGLLTLPLLAKLVIGNGAEYIELKRNVVIETMAASYKPVRRYAVCACLADELAFWPIHPDAAQPDVEVLDAIRPAMRSIPGSKLLLASSPYSMKGVLFDSHKRYFGKDDSDVLVWQSGDASYESELSAARH
jgi:hypothetical protein